MVWHYGGMIEYVWNVWKSSKSSKSANAEKQLRDFITKMGSLAYDAGATIGMYKENVEYLNVYDKMSLANGKPNA